MTQAERFIEKLGFLVHDCGLERIISDMEWTGGDPGFMYGSPRTLHKTTKLVFSDESECDLDMAFVDALDCGDYQGVEIHPHYVTGYEEKTVREYITEPED